MNNIDYLLDRVDWQKVDLPKDIDGLYATHSGILKLGDIELNCYVLNDGRRVFEVEQIESFLGIFALRSNHDNPLAR